MKRWSDSLADFLRYLRHDQQLTNVRYVALMNEPENDYRRPTPADEYIRLNHLLSQSLKERGLGEELSLLGPDDCTGQSSGRSLWWSQTVPQAIDVFDGFSSHTYKHRDTRMLEKWIGDRLEHARQLDPAGPLRPLLVTEFGYVGLTGETFDNPENMAYEYGLFMGDFAIAILNSRASAALTWCLFDQYYDNTHCQHYGLWEFKDHDWQPRPAYYSWSLVNRYTAANSRSRGRPCDTGVRELASGRFVLARGTTDHHAGQPLRPRIAGHTAYGAAAAGVPAGLSLHPGRASHSHRSDVQGVGRITGSGQRIDQPGDARPELRPAHRIRR